MNASTFLGTLGIWTALSSIILVLAWVATLTAKKHAALRHFIWVAAFATLLVVPMMSAFVPARFIIGADQQPVLTGELTLTESDFLALNNANLDLVAAPVAEPVPFDWKPILTGTIAVWAIGFSFFILKLFLGVLQAQAMRRASRLREISPVVPNRATEVRVSLNRRPPSALTWGIFRPIVILPQDSETWSAEKLDAVMRHELAHVRRFDSLSQMLALTLCAVYWFNPLVWLAAKALRADAEIAADDAVVRSGISPSAYAAELLQIATEFGRQRQPLTTIGVSLMKQSQIETRIMSIVDPTNRRRGVANVQGLSVLAVGAFAAVALVSFRPGLAVAQEPTKPAEAPQIAGGQVVKPTTPAEPIKVAEAQVATVKAATVKGKKAKKSKKVNGKVSAKPVVLTTAKGELLLVTPTTVQGTELKANGTTVTNVQGIAWTNPATTVQGTIATDPAKVGTATSVQGVIVSDPARTITTTNGYAVKASGATIETKYSTPLRVTTTGQGKIVHYDWNPKTKKYQIATSLKTATPTQNFFWDPKAKKYRLSTQAVVTPQGKYYRYDWNPKTKKYEVSTAKEVPFQFDYKLSPTKTGTKEYRLTAPAIVYDSVVGTQTKTAIAPLTYSIDITKAQTGTEKEKAQRLAQVQKELDRARAEKQAMEKERNEALSKLKKAQMELEKARAQSKNGKGGDKDVRATVELQLALAERNLRESKARSEVEVLNIRRAEADRKRMVELKLDSKGQADRSRQLLRSAQEKREVELKVRRDMTDRIRKIELERARASKEGQAGLEERAKREAEMKAAEEKAKADKKKSSGS